jgi:protein involved in polysaccharide export with SLBB domain
MPDRLLRFSIAAVLIFAAHSTGFGQVGALRAQPADPSMSQVPMGQYPMMQAERPTTLVDPSRKLQQGDQLIFKIEQDRDPLVPLVVSRTGEVYIDPVGGVRVAGLTVSQAASEIRRLLEKDYYYTATVRLDLTQINQTATMGYVYLSGQVERVGGVPIFAERPMKLSEVILNAGGFKRYADDRKVKLTRGKQTTVVDVKEILSHGRSDLDVILQEGDRVFVPETFMKK